MFTVANLKQLIDWQSFILLEILGVHLRLLIYATYKSLTKKWRLNKFSWLKILKIALSKKSNKKELTICENSIFISIYRLRYHNKKRNLKLSNPIFNFFTFYIYAWIL